MKKGIILFITAIFAFSGCNCGDKPIIENNALYDEINSTTNEEERIQTIITMKHNIDEFDMTKKAERSWKPIYDDAFKEYSNNPSTGVEFTYEEIMDNIQIEKIDSFYIIQIIEVLSDEEARNIVGWNFDKNDDCHIFYKAKKINNLITGEPVNELIYYSTLGNIEYQEEGNPPYVPGDKIATVLLVKEEESDVTRPYADFLLAVDIDVINDSSLMEDDDGMAYKRNVPFNDDKFSSFDEISVSAITSTTENPAKYVQKIDLMKLADFYKNDWVNRGYFVDCLNAEIDGGLNSGENLIECGE